MLGGRIGRGALASAFVALAACRSAYHVAPGSAGSNAAPFANAGTGSTYLAGTTIALDASGSYDPDGQIQTYRWEILAKPFDSSTSIAMPSAPTTQVLLDRPGTYTFELGVGDDQGATAASTVTDVADAPAITVDAGSDQSVAWRQTVQLSGSFQVEAGIPATVQWTFASKPAKSSAAIVGDTTLAPSFVADAEGDYVVRLRVDTVYGSTSATVTVTSSATRDIITYPIVASAYSAALDRFVLASSSPAALHVHDPETGDDIAIPLASAPTAVSLEPTGLRAAVGQNRMVTIVDLQAGTVAHTYTVPLAVGDVAFGGDAHVHCLASGTGFAPIYTLDLATGTVTQAAQSLFEGSKARLSPSGTGLYVYEGTPGYYYRYDATTSPVTYVRLTQSAAGVPWFIQGGAAYVGGGAVYWASDDPALDMQPQVALAEPSGPMIDAVAFAAAADWTATGTLATVGTVQYIINYDNTDAVLNLYDDQTFAPGESILLPDTPYQGMTYKNKAQLVAYRSDGSKLYVLTSAAPVSAIYPVVP